MLLAMFCGQCCAKGNSSISFHRFECPLMDVILKSALTSSMQLAVRTFFLALSLFDGSIDNLEKFLNENSDSYSVFDFDGSADIKQILLAVNSLVSNDKIEVDETVFEEIVLLSTALKDIRSSQSQFVKNFLRKQAQIGTMNYHEIYEWPLKKGGLSDDEINELQVSLAYKRGAIAQGNGSFPFLSLLNHSCSPNVNRIFIDATVILVVMKPVDKGEQLFDDYGYNFPNVPKDIRQLKLLKQYKFECKCHACENDWALFSSLKIFDKTCLNKAKKLSRELKLGVGFNNQRKAIEKFREVCDTLEKGRKNFPSLELCSLEQSFTAFLEMISKPLIEFP